MRNSRPLDDTSPWIELEGQLVGIALGSDFCAEHEWGIDGIKRKLGFDSKLDGIARRTMSRKSDELQYIETKKYQAIFLSPTESFYRHPDSWAEQMRQGLGMAWDADTFGIVARTEADQTKLKELWEAFQRNDIAVWTSVGVFHMGSGLTFVMPSRMPEKYKEELLEKDLSHRRLEARVEEMGIRELLKKAGCKYFALSPKWDSSGVTPEATVMFWLNPMEQHKHEAGWYYLEDLKQWAQGKGPIIKKGKR